MAGNNEIVTSLIPSLDRPKTIFMWLNPRSLSTSLLKCVSSMDGAQAWNEPYSSCYMKYLFTDPEAVVKFPQMQCWVKQFAKTKALPDADSGHIFRGGNLSPADIFTYDWVKEQLEKPLADGQKFRFMKDCAFSIDGRYDKLPNVPIKHTFLIRHSHRVALSLRRLFIHLFEYEGDLNDYDLSSDASPYMAWEKLSPDPVFELWNHVRENVEPNPVVIDADDLQSHPEQILKKYCEAVGIPFQERYLRWEASDGSLKYFHGSLDQMVWGENEGVYDSAFLSSSFRSLQSEIPETVPEKCREYVAEFMEGYKVMYETRIKPE